MKTLILPRWLSSPVLQITLLGSLSWLAYLHLATTYPLADYITKYTLTDFGRANDWKSVTIIDFVICTFRSVLIVFTGSALFSYTANFWWIWNYRFWEALQTNLVFVLVIFIPPILIGILYCLWAISHRQTRMAWRQAAE